VEKLAFTKACLSTVRVITVIMCLLLVEYLCQTAMGRIPAFEYLLPGTRGRLRSCLVMPSIKSGYLLWAQSYQPFQVPRALGGGCWGPECAPSRVTSGFVMG
jgi:hypothetical protein